MSSKRIISLISCIVLLTAMLAVPSFAAVSMADITKTGIKGTDVTFTATDFTSKFTGGTLVSITVTQLPGVAGTLKKGVDPVAAGDTVTLAELPTLKFTPASATVTSASFKISATDGTDTSTEATVSITLVDAVTMSNFSKTAVKGEEIDFTAADFISRFNGGTLVSIKITALPADLAGKLKKGTDDVAKDDVVLTGDLGKLRFVPKDNTVSSATFKFTATDGTNISAEATVTMTFTNPIPVPLKYRDLYQSETDKHWAYPSAGMLAELGLVVGEKMQGGHYYFHPDEYMTRGEFLKYLNAVMEVGLSDNADSAFADITRPYEIEIYNASKEHKFADGTIVGASRYLYPERLLTRAEAIKFVHNALDKPLTSPPALDYADKAQIPVWATTAVRDLTGYGIIQGDVNKNLNPSRMVKRSEAAEMLYKLYQQLHPGTAS